MRTLRRVVPRGAALLIWLASLSALGSDDAYDPDFDGPLRTAAPLAISPSAPTAPPGPGSQPSLPSDLPQGQGPRPRTKDVMKEALRETAREAAQTMGQLLGQAISEALTPASGNIRTPNRDVPPASPERAGGPMPGEMPGRRSKPERW